MDPLCQTRHKPPSVNISSTVLYRPDRPNAGKRSQCLALRRERHTSTDKFLLHCFGFITTSHYL